jgi:hypothetical protein
MHSLEQSFTEPRVPGGLQHMSVVTHLSTVQIVFMNRFLVEFLDYLAGVCGLFSVRLTWHAAQRSASSCGHSTLIGNVSCGSLFSSTAEACMQAMRVALPLHSDAYRWCAGCPVTQKFHCM